MKRLLALALLASTAHAQLRDSDRQEFVFLNRARNGGGERGLVGWVGTGVSPAIVTGSQRSGSNAISWNSTASTQTLNSESVAIPPGFGGCLAEVYYTGAGTANIDAYVEDTSNNKLSGTVVISTAVTALEYQQVQLSFPCPTSSTSVRLELLSAGDAAAIVVDDVYIGRDHRVGSNSISAWASCTITGTWVANTTYVCRRRAVGDTYEYDVSVQLSGAPTALGLVLTLPSDSTIDTSKLSNSTEYENHVGTVSFYDASGAVDVEVLPGVVSVASSSTVRVLVQDNDATSLHWFVRLQETGVVTVATGDRVDMKFKVPVTQLAGQIVQRADALGNFQTAYSGTLVGFGTPSANSFYFQCVGANTLMVRGRWVPGTTTGTEARLPLPTGFTTSANYTTLAVGGMISKNASSATAFGWAALIEPNATYLTIGHQSSTANVQTKQLGNALGASGDVFILAPTLVEVSSGCGNVPRAFVAGGVFADSAGLERAFRARLTISNSAAAIVSQSGGLSIANGAGAGLSTLTFLTALSSEAGCSCTVIGAAVATATACTFVTSSASTIAISRVRAGAAENGDVSLFCMGAK